MALKFNLTLKQNKMKKHYLFFTLCIILTSNILIGQTTSTVAGKTPIRIETPKNWNKNKSKSAAAVYNAPPNCVIMDFTLNVVKRNGPVQHSVNFVQGASRFISTQEMNDAFSSADNLAVNLNIKGTDYLDLKAKLDSKYTEYERTQNTIEASHATIEHKAIVNGNGRFNGRSWYEGNTTVKLICYDDFMSSKTALDEKLKEFVQRYADSIAKMNADNNATNNGDTNSSSSTKFNGNNQTGILTPTLIIIIVIIVGTLILIIFIRRKRKI